MESAEVKFYDKDKDFGYLLDPQGGLDIRFTSQGYRFPCYWHGQVSFPTQPSSMGQLPKRGDHILFERAENNRRFAIRWCFTLDTSLAQAWSATQEWDAQQREREPYEKDLRRWHELGDERREAMSLEREAEEFWDE